MPEYGVGNTVRVTTTFEGVVLAVKGSDIQITRDEWDHGYWVQVHERESTVEVLAAGPCPFCHQEIPNA